MTDPLITVDDFRVVGICPRSKHWFESHGLDWKDFIKNGILLSKLRETGDQQTMVDRLEASAKKRIENNGR